MTGKAVNSPKTGTGRHELPTELETPLPAALYLNLKSVRRRICGHGAQRGANRTSPAPLSAAAPPSNSGRGFQRGGPQPAPLCHEGVWGTGGVPHVSGGGLRGRGLYAKGPFPLPYHGNVPLREQRTMRKRTAMPCAFSLAEIMTAARRNSKLFVKGNDRFDLMKANFVT